MSIKNVVLTTSETEIFKNTGTKRVVILTSKYRNKSSTSTSLTIYAYPNGGTATEDSTEYSVDVAPTDTYTSTAKYILHPNETLSAKASSASSIVATISYMEMGS